MDFAKKREELLKLTKSALGEAIGPDQEIIQNLATIDELIGQLNIMSKRLREWHGYVLPTASHSINDHEVYVRLVATKSLEDLKKEFGSDMASVISEDSYETIVMFARQIDELYKFKILLLNSLEQRMRKYLPNVTEVAGSTIAARLLSAAGSLKRLSVFPSSTIQLFGAETALFRHLKTGARSPKYGYLFSHPIVQRTKDKGKAARAIADKIAICAKLDYFKGEFLGDKYLEELEERFQ